MELSPANKMLTDATCGPNNIKSASIKGENDAIIEVSGPVVYSKILPHSPEAGDPYYIGDAYSESPVSREWEINTTETPYLAHIKSLSTAWPTLKYLADFMEVSTTPLRWNFLRDNEAERKERIQRTNVTVLDFSQDGNVTRRRCTVADELNDELRRNSRPTFEKSSLRLIVVEDLSRSVVETLGAMFDIDPAFFRQHIDDYSWYNIRDRWMDPPNLIASTKHQNWTQVRFVRPIYFETRDSLRKGREESNRFNVLRRPDNDSNQWPYMDGDSVVGLMRTKVSIWVGKNPDSEVTGIVLVDPTIKEGRPLWHGYSNWASTPGMLEKDSPPSGPPRTSLFDDLIYWMSNYPWPTSLAQKADSKCLLTMIQPILYLTCAEWLIMCQYVKSRLGQIEWELANPSQFYKDTRIIDNSLTRLHTWRRVIPLYREMLTETLQRLDPSEQNSREPETRVNSNILFCEDIRTDVQSILTQMSELQDRTDRLTSMVVAAISIDDSHRSLQESRNVARLTWLASVFIPLSFVTGLFSMQEDISKLRTTVGWYFVCAVPVTLITLSAVMIANYHVEKEAKVKKRHQI